MRIKHLINLVEIIGQDIGSILKKLEKLEKGQSSPSITTGDRIHIYRRTQTYNFINPENGSYSWSGQQISYSLPMPEEFVGKFCEVFINGNVDARVPKMPPNLTLYSQDTQNGDEILIVAYEDNQHVTDELNAHGQ